MQAGIDFLELSPVLLKSLKNSAIAKTEVWTESGFWTDFEESIRKKAETEHTVSKKK
jgi:hypothetical protein